MHSTFPMRTYTKTTKSSLHSPGKTTSIDDNFQEMFFQPTQAYLERTEKEIRVIKQNFEKLQELSTDDKQHI